jgi:hypothetical protein
MLQELDLRVRNVSPDEIAKSINSWRDAIIDNGDKHHTDFGCSVSRRMVLAEGVLRLDNYDFGRGDLLIPFGLMSEKSRRWQEVADYNQRLAGVTPSEDGWVVCSRNSGYSNGDLERINAGDWLIKNGKLTIAGLVLAIQYLHPAFAKQDWVIIRPKRISLSR